MAARDQVLFAETFLALKKALKRKAYDSDSDASIDQTTNRGNKLKKRARFVREGQLAQASSASAQKEVVEHGGYQRAIIQHNPPLIDEDGYEIESDDDEENVQEALASAALLNPYAGIRLENILAPLTSVTDLPNHPTLSRPFTSKALTELAGQGGDWMHKENAALWKVKPLLTRLCGDHTWAACDLMETPNDAELFDEDFIARFLNRSVNGLVDEDAQGRNTPKLNGDGSTDRQQNTANGEKQQAPEEDGTIDADQSSAKADLSMADAEANESEPSAGTKTKLSEQVNGDVMAGSQPEEGQDPPIEGDHTLESKAQEDRQEVDRNANGSQKETEKAAADVQKAKEAVDEDAEMANGEPNGDLGGSANGLPNAGASDVNGSRAMSITPDVFEDQFIHPLFLAPRSAHPERDLGLPEQEAEDIRRLLQLWVQKQEEVTRGTKKLHEGLLKADRLRKTVLKWSKAEAHCGSNRDLSDGEDWYDKDEWGLTEDLKKGQDEEEEDTQQTQKKTRARR